jgi:uncharacterized membrane protein
MNHSAHEDPGKDFPGEVDRLPTDKIKQDVAEKVPTFKRIPDADKDRTVEIIAHEILMVSGPLPAPSVLSGYGQVDQSFPERILQMAELNQKHVIDIDKSQLQNEYIRAKDEHYYSMLGLILGFLAILCCFLTIGLLAYLGHPEIAAIIAGVGIVSLATVFVLGRSQRLPQSTENSKRSSEPPQPSRKRKNR